MDYGMIGKIEKSKIYADERDDRVQFQTFRAKVNGDNSIHIVSYDAGKWYCDCNFFSTRAVCSHTMTMERVLRNMVEMG